MKLMRFGKRWDFPTQRFLEFAQNNNNKIKDLLQLFLYDESADLLTGRLQVKQISSLYHCGGLKSGMW